jgi:hypothetical protein
MNYLLRAIAWVFNFNLSETPAPERYDTDVTTLAKRFIYLRDVTHCRHLHVNGVLEFSVKSFGDVTDWQAWWPSEWRSIYDNAYRLLQELPWKEPLEKRFLQLVINTFQLDGSVSSLASWHDLCVTADLIAPATEQGHDARINGFPLGANPHDVPERIAEWRAGYLSQHTLEVEAERLLAEGRGQDS